tara:strand:+ start:1229 stop:1705 length:477 start_codon:yes stop_codon:yes gene_type:complete
MAVKLDKKILQKLKRNVRFMDGSNTQTGFFGAKPHDSKGNTTATIALWQEYGTQVGRGNSKIPERPFMSSTYIKAGNYRSSLVKAARDILTGKSTTKTSLDKLGKKVAMDMQLSLWAWSTPPNADSTVDRKGFDFPLVETMTLFNSIKSRTKINGGKK